MASRKNKNRSRKPKAKAAEASTAAEANGAASKKNGAASKKNGHAPKSRRGRSKKEELRAEVVEEMSATRAPSSPPLPSGIFRAQAEELASIDSGWDAFL